MVAVYVAQAVVQLVPLSTTLLSNRPVFASLLPAERAMFGIFGACYLVGSQVYAYQTPKLWPGSFGYHELWHLLIALSSLRALCSRTRSTAAYSPTARAQGRAMRRQERGVCLFDTIY